MVYHTLFLLRNIMSRSPESFLIFVLAFYCSPDIPCYTGILDIIINLLISRTPATMGVNGKKDHVPVPMDKLAMAKQMAAKLTAKTATINKSEVGFVTIVK